MGHDDYIEEHNQKQDPVPSYTLGHNHFSDIPNAEFRKMHSLGQHAPDFKPLLEKRSAKMQKLQQSSLLRGGRNGSDEESDLMNLPTHEVNWVESGAVTPVKNQERCGSCWAFSATGSIEGAEFLHGTKKLTSLSEQQLVDCSKKNDACQGGLMDYAFEYVEENPLMEESAYPYTGHHSNFSKCKYEASKGVGHVKGFKDVTPRSGDQMKAALAMGPVSVAIEADKSVFQSYRSGVITSRLCGKKLDHGVLAVGYGTEDGEDYFLVKNSWGASWGSKGYVKIGQDDVCGILDQPSYPTE